MKTDGQTWNRRKWTGAPNRVTPGVVGRASGRVLLAACLASIAVAGTAGAATSEPLAGEKVPRQLPYRGTLELDGVPVTNPSVSMGFELCVSETGTGAAECPWSETQVVSVQGGNFSVALGDAANNPIPPRLFAQPKLYVGISVNGQKLQGRQRLLTVPYAHYSGASSAVPVGAIMAFWGSKAPDGWLLCDGTTFTQSEHPALYEVLGNRTQLPNLSGRFPLGASGTVGAAGGASTMTLKDEHLPTHDHGGVTASAGAHTHTVRFTQYSSGYGDVRGGGDPSDQSIVKTTSSEGEHSHTISAAGLGRAFGIMPPYLTVNWIIRADP